MVATKAKSKGTPKSKASATRYYQAKMASRQADALKRGRARVAKASQEEKRRVEKDIREAFEGEKEMFRRAAERMAQADKEQQEEWFRATRPDREAPKAKPEGSKSQRKTTTAQKQARETKQQQKRKETPKPAAKPKKATNKNRAAQKKKDEEEEKEAFRESRQSRATKSSKEKRAEKFEARRQKQEVEMIDEDSDGELELTDVEDPVADLASVGIDISKLTLDQLKRIAPLSMLLDKMSPDQIKEALSFSTFSPDGRPIIRTNVVKPREIPRNTHRFVLDDKGNRIYVG
jgi:hypothetical protein